MSDLSNHRSSERLKRKAEAEGLDLEKLKREQPEQYKMIHSLPLLYADPGLTSSAGEVFFSLFPDKDLYQLSESKGLELLRVFPALTTAEKDRFDEALGQLVVQPGFQERWAYYRVVNDLRGERRELALPVAPEKWQRELGMVGPFDSQEAAQAWGDENVKEGMTGDAIVYAARWFYDVFLAAEV